MKLHTSWFVGGVVFTLVGCGASAGTPEAASAGTVKATGLSGTVNGRPAVAKHAFITTAEGPGSVVLQAFTSEKAPDVACPNGVQFVAEGELVEVTFLDQKEQSDLDRFRVEDTKGRVKLQKGSGALRGKVTAGATVPVEVHVDGANGTKLDGVIDAIVCQPPTAQ